VVQERYGYHPYGTPVVLTGAFAFRASSDFHWETMFAGYRYDEEISHYQVRNRVLSGTTGRWLQRDPLGYTDTFNLYEYVASSPVRSLDPSGRGLEWVLFVITVSKGGVVVAVILVVLLAVAWAIIRLVEQIKAWYRKDDCEDVEVIIETRTEKKEKCKLIGSGGCNKKKGLKRCTYSCPRGEVEAPIPCGPGNWDPACPGWDGTEVEL
jgi:RHS repeat-associated protein